MKIRKVSPNNRRKAFEVRTPTRTLLFPYAKLDPPVAPGDRIIKAFVDNELGREAFSYVLQSGKEGSVHIEQILEYNQDPGYLRRDHSSTRHLSDAVLSLARPNELSKVGRSAPVAPTDSGLQRGFRRAFEERLIPFLIHAGGRMPAEKRRHLALQAAHGGPEVCPPEPPTGGPRLRTRFVSSMRPGYDVPGGSGHGGARLDGRDPREDPFGYRRVADRGPAATHSH